MASLLPDELLAAISERAGAAEGPAVTLVCKRWNRVFYSAPGVWRQFAVTAPRQPEAPTQEEEEEQLHQQQQWAAARLRLLRRVSGMVESLRIFRGDELEATGIASGGRVAVFVHFLSPELAREVCLLGFNDISLPAEGLAVLHRLTRLESLALDSSELPVNTAAVLRRLSPSLRSLNMSAGRIDPAVLEALPQLLQLTSLQLSSYRQLPPFDWQRLTALQQLWHLGLCQADSSDKAPLAPPPPAIFPDLRSLHFSTLFQGLQLAGTSMRELQYQTISCKPERPREELSFDAEAEEHVQRLQDQTLSLEGVQTLAGLRPLLDASLTPRTPLRCLSIDMHAPLPAADVAGCETHLSSLQALRLSHFARRQEGASPGTLESLLEQAPHLTSLTATKCLQGTLPTFLANRTGLQDLYLGFNGLCDLPAGPYLSSLESLGMSGEDRLLCLPTALTAAKRLTSLTLNFDTALQLSTADLDARLPASLRHLELAENGLTHLPPFRQLSSLTSLDLSMNLFSTFPPSLEAATALVELDLTLNDDIPLSPADVDALLARCPRLRRLLVGSSYCRSEVFEHLGASAPHVKLS
ncbi:hypothetical protein ABPG75_011318 [Micractinium tetrahymenae]